VHCSMMRLQIMSLSGPLVSDLEVDDSWKVADVIHHLRTVKPPPEGSIYRVCVGNQVLAQDRTLESYGVTDGVDLFAVLVQDDIVLLLDACLNSVENPGNADWMNASRDLRKKGHRAAPYARQIANIAERGGPAVRFQLVTTLGYLGPEAAPEISQFLQDKIQIVQRAAADALQRMGEASKQYADEIKVVMDAPVIPYKLPLPAAAPPQAPLLQSPAQAAQALTRTLLNALQSCHTVVRPQQSQSLLMAH